MFWPENYILLNVFVFGTACLKFIKNINYFHIVLEAYLTEISTVKLGDKERFDKEQIGVKEPFPMTNC